MVKLAEGGVTRLRDTIFVALLKVAYDLKRHCGISQSLFSASLSSEKRAHSGAFGRKEDSVDFVGLGSTASMHTVKAAVYIDYRS